MSRKSIHPYRPQQTEPALGSGALRSSEHSSAPPQLGYLARLTVCWREFWFSEVPAYPLAAFRILFGIYLLFYFLAYIDKVTVVFSSGGVYSPYLIPDLALPPLGAGIVYAFMLAVVVAFTVGYRTRFLTPVLLLLYLYFYFLNIAVKNTSYDRLNIIFLTILCLTDVSKVWALNPGQTASGKPKNQVSVWALRLITIQLCLLYFGSGIWKLLNPSWHTGAMLKWTLIGPWGTALGFSVASLDPPDWVYDILTWAVIALELAMPLGLFVRSLRNYAIYLGCSFHLAVAFFLNIPEFLNCVCAYVLFLTPEEVQRAGNNVFKTLTGIFGRMSAE